ncbi:MAG: hypothetical protein GF311_19170 [Candidatus Lokiarchaeota archaeon]|jgi:hypothetical protein|nr:hypothetical protein [Candidatus Lokiarchaeota archaeon]
MPDKEKITELAFRRYKSGESYEKSVWYLAYYTLKINKNIKNGGAIQPLETDNLVLLLNENINGSLLEPDEAEVKLLAEQIYHEHPEKSKLHWFIAEKILLLKEIEEILNSSRN